MRILGLDVGTSSVKAAVLDSESGRPLFHPVKVPYEFDHPTPDAAEIPAERLKSTVWRAARDAVTAHQGDTVEGIGISCLMPALVLLDENLKPLTPIWIHLDRRSRPVARKVLAEVGDEFLRTCGNPPLPGGMSVLCFAEQVEKDPSLRGRVRRYLHANGWLASLLTGAFAFDSANASFTGLFGTLTDRRWSARWCDYFDVDAGWLPDVVSGDATVGGLRTEVARELGLPAGIPVKIGTADTSSGMLASGMTPDDLYVTVGTTTVLARFVESPRPDPRRLTRMFGIGASFIYATHNPVGGSALPWLMQLCFSEYLPENRKQEFYQKIIPEASKRATEVKLDPPFLGGDRLQIESKHATFRELTLATDRRDLLAALLNAMREGHRTAFDALDWNWDAVQRIFLTGGGSDLLPILLPEFSDDKVQVIEEGALRGTARLFA